MSGLDELVAQRRARGWKGVAGLVCLLLVVTLVWASFTRLDEVSIAMGQVVPLGNVKVIQHLEGGMIEAIHVREGDTVTSGAPLLGLVLGANRLNREELQARLGSLRLRRARLLAESAGGEARYPDDVTRRQPDVATAEQRTLAARRSELTSSIAVFSAQIEQGRQTAAELRARRAAVVSDLALARRKLVMSGNLMKQGLTTELAHIDTQREVGRLRGERAVLNASLPRAAAVRAEAENRILEIRTRFRRRAFEELGGIEIEINRSRELLIQATRQAARADIRSPIDGIVKNLRYHTIGGVVQPGAPIMEIVPSGDRLVIEVRLDPADRGYVRLGQKALVKISTYDYVRYGGLDGTVVRIAPGSDTDGRGQPYFSVIVETSRAWLGESEGALRILPGMEATVDIHTGARTVIDYFLRPVLKLKSEAFRER